MANDMLGLRIDPELKKQAEKFASRDFRSLTNIVTMLLTGYVDLNTAGIDVAELFKKALEENLNEKRKSKKSK